MNHNNQYSKCIIQGIEIVDGIYRKEGPRDLHFGENNSKKVTDTKGGLTATLDNQSLISALSSKNSADTKDTDGKSITTKTSLDTVDTTLWEKVTLAGDIEKLQPANREEME